MEALGIRTLAASLRNSTANECSHNQDKQTNKNVRGEGSDSFEYLPGAEEGQEDEDESVYNSLEKVSSQSRLGVFTLRCPMYIVRLIFMQVLITDLFTLPY